MPRFKTSTIRARLLIGFVLMTLLPTIGVSVGTVAVSYVSGRRQAIDRLESVAALKGRAVEEWINSLQTELVIASNTDLASERIGVLLTLANDDRYYDFYHKAVRQRLQALVQQSQQLQELFLLDVYGRVALSTDVAQEGRVYTEQPYFQRGLTGPYAQLPFFSPGPSASVSDPTSVFIAIPVTGGEGQALGVMVGRAPLQSLTRMLHERTGAGRTGKAYLVNASHALLSGLSLPALNSNDDEPRPIHSDGINAAIDHHVSVSGIYDDYRGASVVGIYRWLPELNAALAVEQDLSEAFGAIFTIMGINLSIAVIAVLLAVAAALFVMRTIATPLVNLSGAATQIASGDLQQTAQVERDDEIGALAQAFNSMTAQLRDLINGLEQRVTERTHALQAANVALERRALQLETSAQVSREVTSILDIDALLTQVVELIRDAFGYYHVLIFLVDKTGTQLVLRASSSAVSPQIQQLKIGQKSLNGRAVQTGAAQLVNDVTTDAYYLPDEHLPGTRSELVIPLRLGEQVIGTLDVHSAQVNAFTPEDGLVIQSLGDQIAVAIENARLYDRSRELAVLQERTRLARELHDSVTQSLYSLTLLTEGWRRLADAGSKAHVQDYLIRIGEITQQALKEMRLLIHELRPPALEQEGLVGALHQRLDAVEKRAGVEARILMDDLIELPATVEEELYRIAQEALNNALKHAGATAVTVRLCTEDSQVVLEVTDNGCGFDPATVKDCGGMGLISMHERARQLGGALSVTSASGQGTTVRACAPAARASVS